MRMFNDTILACGVLINNLYRFGATTRDDYYIFQSEPYIDFDYYIDIDLNSKLIYLYGNLRRFIEFRFLL
jgi:hypothetical protein